MARGVSVSHSALIHRGLLSPPSVLAARSTRFSSSSPSDHGDSMDPLLRRLEDVIHHIIVRRSEPDWLPFRPGSSYWVPPRSNSRGIAQMIGKLTAGATRLSSDESMSAATPHGWPSPSYFIHGSNPTPRPIDIEAEMTSDEAVTEPEDEEV